MWNHLFLLKMIDFSFIPLNISFFLNKIEYILILAIDWSAVIPWVIGFQTSF